jgi:Fe2+ or Zn2+ uptake regulation protein
MIEIAKKAHWECEKCNATICFEPEDVIVDEEEKAQYGNYRTRYYTLKTYYVQCPVCTEKHIIRTEECEEKTRSRY